MNISHLMRSLIGEQTVGDSRSLELKVGQVVRGTVASLLDNNEAMLNIQGVQVRAKLETPMQAGQAAFLQVQPQSSGSSIIFKQVDPIASGILDDTFRDIAKSLGLPDQKWALDLVKDLRTEGFTLNRQAAEAFKQAAALLPQGASMEQWMQAAAAAFRRGMPLTSASIAAMQQIMFGAPLHELTSNLERMLSSLLQADKGNSLAASDGKSSFMDAGRQMLATLQSSGAAIHSGLTQASGNSNWLGQFMKQLGVSYELQLGKMASQELAAQAREGTAGQSNQLFAGKQLTDVNNMTSQPSKQAGGTNSTLDQSLLTGRATTAAINTNTLNVNLPEQKLTTIPAGERSTVGTATGGEAAKTNSEQVQRATIEGAVSARQNTGAPMLAAQQAATDTGNKTGAGAPQAVTQSATTGGHRIEGLQEATSVPTRMGGQEQMDSSARPVFLASEQSQAAQPVQHNSPSAPPAQGEQAIAGTISQPRPGAEQLTQLDSIKGALLQLMAANDTPAAVRELASQLNSHITGQQLMLTAERNHSLFTHVTMFVPLQDSSGNKTAAVHIQTRRGIRGELDAENCRLLFNLSMAAIGETLIDVQIVDRIVSLHVWNNHPAIQALSAEAKDELSDRLETAGYQLALLKAVSLPKEEKEGEQVAAPVAKEGKTPKPPDVSSFSSTRYKGVDLKV